MPDEDPGKSTISQPKLRAVTNDLDPENIALNDDDSQDEISSQDLKRKSDVKKTDDSTSQESSSNFA